MANLTEQGLGISFSQPNCEQIDSALFKDRERISSTDLPDLLKDCGDPICSYHNVKRTVHLLGIENVATKTAEETLNADNEIDSKSILAANPYKQTPETTYQRRVLCAPTKPLRHSAQTLENAVRELWDAPESMKIPVTFHEPWISTEDQCDSIDEMIANAASTTDEFFTPLESFFPDHFAIKMSEGDADKAPGSHMFDIDDEDKEVDISEPTIGFAEIAEAHHIEYVSKGMAKEIDVCNDETSKALNNDLLIKANNDIMPFQTQQLTEAALARSRMVSLNTPGPMIFSFMVISLDDLPSDHCGLCGKRYSIIVSRDDPDRAGTSACGHVRCVACIVSRMNAVGQGRAESPCAECDGNFTPGQIGVPIGVPFTQQGVDAEQSWREPNFRRQMRPYTRQDNKSFPQGLHRNLSLTAKSTPTSDLNVTFARATGPALPNHKAIEALRSSWIPDRQLESSGESSRPQKRRQHQIADSESEGMLSSPVENLSGRFAGGLQIFPSESKTIQPPRKRRNTQSTVTETMNSPLQDSPYQPLPQGYTTNLQNNRLPPIPIKEQGFRAKDRLPPIRIPPISLNEDLEAKNRLPPIRLTPISLTQEGLRAKNTTGESKHEHHVPPSSLFLPINSKDGKTVDPNFVNNFGKATEPFHSPKGAKPKDKTTSSPKIHQSKLKAGLKRYNKANNVNYTLEELEAAVILTQSSKSPANLFDILNEYYPVYERTSPMSPDLQRK
ncbi:uncharacterized protein KY384_001902 [Bacidia gigantensis]|uniref:uncharacterized protein n=1 Tax=Bacidia gigantensis TaxID=2732470 RepID=UPI001D05A372|nr:uncharacterized protein KY384_001902 [Bacidia gigantensis]KAG8533119.1 hypothetical protein KY384_001902 [Bacidia gigantensis]